MKFKDFNYRVLQDSYWLRPNCVSIDRIKRTLFYWSKNQTHYKSSNLPYVVMFILQSRFILTRLYNCVAGINFLCYFLITEKRVIFKRIYETFQLRILHLKNLLFLGGCTHTNNVRFDFFGCEGKKTWHVWVLL